MKATRPRFVWVRAIGGCSFTGKQGLVARIPLLWAVALLLQSENPTVAAVNEWTKSTSGSWEEPYWSLGLPSSSQTVAFTNAGWKALAIGADTTAHYPDSLTVNDLIVDAPTDSFNQLLLNWAGLSVPLVVRSNFILGANGSLASHYSALHAANVQIDGSASFSDYATEDFGQLSVRSGASVSLTNGSMTCSNLTFSIATTFTQNGGRHIAQTINLPLTPRDWALPSAIYNLQGGALISRQVWMGAGGGHGPEGHGTIWQTGGVHTNGFLRVGGWVHYGGSIHLGTYGLSGGLLVSSNVDVYGSFIQGGGTNIVQQLNVAQGGDFSLKGGELITSNTSAYLDPYVLNDGFVQKGGVHTVHGRLFIDGWPYEAYRRPSYELADGKLVTAGTIEIAGGALSISSNGVVSNTGILLLSGGDLVGNDATQTQYLGQLQVSGGTLDVHPAYSFAKPTVWRFADSHTRPWTGPLQINNWGLNPGDHIYFGTNAQGLTSAQLDQIGFTWNHTDYYPAILLPTGEVVPVSGTNQWTKPTNGNWEESYWSLGRLPGFDQALTLFNNPGWKALAIGANTTANYPASLSLHNLVVAGPTNSFNQLILNWAGLTVPLDVHWDLTIGTNASLVSHYSALRAGSTYIDGSLSLSDGSVADLGKVSIRRGGAVNLLDGSMISSNLTFTGAIFSQSGGIHLAQNINLPTSYYMDFYDGSPPPSFYYLQNGALISQDLTLDSSSDTYGAVTSGTFMQSGGVHTNSVIKLTDHTNRRNPGAYILDGGLLVSASVDVYLGSFVQQGGTNLIQQLRNVGHWSLDGGLLVTSNAVVVFSTFLQHGGTHLVSSNLVIGTGWEYEGGTSTYDLMGGNLVTSNIEINTGTLLLSSHGVVSNAGILTFSSYFPGAIRANNVDGVQYLGKLQMSYGGTLDLHAVPSQPINATAFRFSDSHALAWTGQLQITNWGLNPGDHIYFGTNAQALTAEQLAQVQFVGNNANYSAKLLPTGEVVPALPPPVGLAKLGNALVLSWPAGYDLFTATNVSGPYVLVPGAASPFTNTFKDPLRFFRLGGGADAP